MDGQQVDATPTEPGLWVTISRLAEIKGTSKQAVSKRVKRLRESGAIDVRVEGPVTKVNLVQYDRAIGANTDPAQALRNLDRIVLPATAPSSPQVQAEAPASKSSGYLLHKETSAAYQAENARLDLEERLGRICDRADVENRTFAVFRRLRDRLLSLPSICAPRAANAADERSVRLILDEEVRKMLETLAKELDKPDGDVEDDEDLSGVSAAGLQ